MSFNLIVILGRLQTSTTVQTCRAPMAEYASMVSATSRVNVRLDTRVPDVLLVSI